MLTAEQIAVAKKQAKYAHKEQLHEHDDCIRIAYEWLDAQEKTRGLTRLARPLKHIIEKWGGRYVSQSDVEVAAQLHPKIKGSYPHFNLSRRFIKPSDERLAGISQARTQDYSMTPRHIKEAYARSE